MKGEDERPWNERVQSTCFSSSLSIEGGSSRPSVRERSGWVSEEGERVEETCCAFATACAGDGVCGADAVCDLVVAGCCHLEVVEAKLLELGWRVIR